MKKISPPILILAALAATAACILPLLSTYLSEGESCTMIVRGYNLPAFSAWGCIPLLSPALFVAILFSHQSKGAKEVETLLLLTANAVSFTHAFYAAKTWLEALGGSPLTYHPGTFLYPLTFIVLLLLAKTLDFINQN